DLLIGNTICSALAKPGPKTLSGVLVNPESTTGRSPESTSGTEKSSTFHVRINNKVFFASEVSPFNCEKLFATVFSNPGPNSLVYRAQRLDHSSSVTNRPKLSS